MSFPTTPKPLHITIATIAPANVSVAHSQRTIRSSRGSHRFTFSLTYPPLTRAQIAPLWAFIQAQQGRVGSFDFTAADIALALGSMAGTPLVDGADQSGNTLVADGFTPSTTDVLKAGDYIRIAGQYKTYIVTADVDADGAGSASIPIQPALQAVPSDDAAITAAGTFRCRLGADAHSLDITAALHYGFELDLVEVLD